MTEKDTALAEARKLQAVMAKHGVKCTIELKAGRNGTWHVPKRAVMNHHTAGSARGYTPTYEVCRNGRSDLPGPLCNGYGGRDHVYRIITLGLANHPGQGGPLTVGGLTIPRDSARSNTWGTEWEHVGTKPWPADMVDFMARCNAALNEYHAIPLGRQIEHSTWTSRKIDRNGYTAKRGQDEVARYLASRAPAKKAAPPPAKKAPAKKALPPRYPAFPLPNGHWFGPPSKDPRNHSGFYSSGDREKFKAWQRQMVKRGWRGPVNGVVDDHWADVIIRFRREKRLGSYRAVGKAAWDAAWTAPVK